MNNHISYRLYKAIKMAYLYQVNCELTPEQCKELLNVIDDFVKDEPDKDGEK